MHETWPSLLATLSVPAVWTAAYLLALYIWDRR